MKFASMELASKLYIPLSYNDEDSLPTCSVPRPLRLGLEQVESQSDLDISMTPEKIGMSCGILKKSEGDNGGRKASRRQVRFHFSSDSDGKGGRSYTPSIPSVRLVEDTDPVIITVVPQEKKQQKSDWSISTNPASIFAGTSGKASKGKPYRTAKLNKTGKQVARAAAKASAESLTMEQCTLGMLEQCTLGTPEVNTTLALTQELQGVEEAEFDAKKAVEEQLKKSFVTRQNVEGKINEGLNIPRDQPRFQGLVTLEVPVDQVLNTAAPERRPVVKPRADPKKDGITDGPDLLMFYNPSELLSESPYLPVEGLPSLKLQPRVKPLATAFDLYRKLKQWEA